MIALLALSSLALAFQATPSVGLTSYEEAVRCAGVTQAASELEGGESRQGRALYDAALYWSLAAMQAGGVPAGFNVITGALYEKDTAQVYDDILSGK